MTTAKSTIFRPRFAIGDRILRIGGSRPYCDFRVCVVVGHGAYGDLIVRHEGEDRTFSIVGSDAYSYELAR